MKDLEAMIREAKARLEGQRLAPVSIQKWQQRKKLASFDAKVKSKLDPDTWAAMFPRENRWLKGAPALEFWIDKEGSREQQFLLRAVKGGFELDGPGDTVPITDDDKFNDRLLAAIGDALDARKQK